MNHWYRIKDLREAYYTQYVTYLERVYGEVLVSIIIVMADSAYWMHQ